MYNRYIYSTERLPSSRVPSIDQMSAWVILLHAHDHIIQNRNIPLSERIQSCDLLYRLSLQAIR